MKSTLTDFTDTADILDEEYYSIGIDSGHEALGNLLDDWFAGRLDEFLHENSVHAEDFPELLLSIAKNWNDNGKMWKSHSDFYGI